MSDITDMLKKDLGEVFFSDFSVRVTPETWGGVDFMAIFDEQLVELNDASLEASYIDTEADNVPAGASQGDILTVNFSGCKSTRFKLLDVQIVENGIKRLILGAV
tara:strand:+ start:99 stop:413 length:315 start_codon:yes stop_codon:yes gene_type:complete